MAGGKGVAGPAHGLGKLQNSVFLQRVDVGQIVYAVEEAEVCIVGAQRFQLPGEGPLDLAQIPGPAVFAAFVVDGAQMQMEEDLLPAAADGLAEGLVGLGRAGAEVEEVDAVGDGGLDDLPDLCRRGLLDASQTQPKRAEALCGSAGGEALGIP